MTIQSQEQFRRTVEAKAETIQILDRARCYSRQFQDMKLICSMEAHLAKLDGMIAAYLETKKAA